MDSPCSKKVVFQELVNAGEDVLIFYNDKASFNHFLEMMRSERNRMDDSSPLCYHIELVRIRLFVSYVHPYTYGSLKKVEIFHTPQWYSKGIM